MTEAVCLPSPPKAFAKQPRSFLWGLRVVSRRRIGVLAEGGNAGYLGATLRQHPFLRTKEAWPSEGPRGTLAGVSAQTLPAAVEGDGVGPLCRSPFPPASYPTRSQVEAGPEERVLDATPGRWWFSSLSSVASPLSAQPPAPRRDQKYPAAWGWGGCPERVCAELGAKHLAGGEGGFWKAS